MFLAGFNSFPYSSYAQRVRSRALKEPTVAPNGVVHAVLRCPMELCTVNQSDVSPFTTVDRLIPSDAKTIGLSGLEGSDRQKTSANPSDASRR